MSKQITFDGLTEQYGAYSKDGVDYAIEQHPYLDTVAGTSNAYLVSGESYYFATGYDRAGNAYRLIWEITNPDTDDESNAADWESFEVMPIAADPAPWHPDMQDAE